MKSTRMFIVLSCLITFIHGDISPNPNPYFVTNGNGVSQGPLYLQGGVKYAWEEDEQGFTVLQAGNRTYYYAVQDANTGDLVMTNLPLRKKVSGVLTGTSPLSLGIKRHEQLSDIVKKQKCGDFCTDGKGTGRELRNLVATTGKLKNLMVLFKFSDHTSRTLPTPSDITTLMNHAGDGVNIAYDTIAPTGSVREHYLKSSYGQLQIDSVVTSWVTIDYTEAYCSGGNRGLSSIIHACLSNALSKVDPQVNFTQFDLDGNKWIDAIGFLHSGYGAEWGGYDAYNTYYTSRIWSHKWGLYTTWTSAEGVSVSSYHISPAVWGTSGSSIGRIGVIAHETGHYLGLPDLYDTDNDGSGIGSWSLMANSWGFTGNQYYPPPMDAWCKMMLGWVTPTVISPSQTPLTLGPQCQSSTVYKITTNFPSGEYLLVENRQKVCLYDSQMGGTFTGGLAIFHIDENQPSFNTQGNPGQSGWPSNYNHYRVALLQADKLYELEKNANRGNYGDLYHDGDTLGPSTSSSGPYPNSDSYAYGLGVKQTRISISSIAKSGNNIAFVFTANLSSVNPSNKPSLKPSISPQPTKKPTSKPTPRKPTSKPTRKPSRRPSRKPSRSPTRRPSRKPSRKPSSKPTPRKPTRRPSRPKPTRRPSKRPSLRPTKYASRKPTRRPSRRPSLRPTKQPSTNPSARRTTKPSSKPTTLPSTRPSLRPTNKPTTNPSARRTTKPSSIPSTLPSAKPFQSPTTNPTGNPTAKPSDVPTVYPTIASTAPPSLRTPTITPSVSPISNPTVQPTV